MKKLSLLLVFIGSFQAFAISDEDLAQKCFDKGVEKISAQAQAWNCEVDLEQVEVDQVDNRWYNPSKYIWYQVIGECNGYDRIIQLVQFSKGKCI